MVPYNTHTVARCSKRNVYCILSDSKKKIIYYDSNNALSQLQKYGKNYEGRKYQKMEEEFYNHKQNRLYKLAMYGLDALKEEERRRLSFKETLKIEQAHSKTQRFLNRWKQQLISDCISNFLLKSFPHSKVIKEICQDNTYTCDKEVSMMSFASLGMTKKKRIEKMIEWQILPSNFYNL